MKHSMENLKYDLSSLWVLYRLKFCWVLQWCGQLLAVGGIA